MSHTTIKSSDAPGWNFFYEIRGAKYPLVSPLEAKDMPLSPLPSQVEIDAMNQRWPGLLVWAWRMIVGAPRVRRDDLPGDGGADHVRSVCSVILGGAHDDLIADMSTGECAQLFAAYTGLQEEWLAAARRWAADQAKSLKGYSKQDQEPTQSASGMEKIIPGGVVPAAMNAVHHPLINDDRVGGVV